MKSKSILLIILAASLYIAGNAWANLSTKPGARPTPIDPSFDPPNPNSWHCTIDGIYHGQLDNLFACAALHDQIMAAQDEAHVLLGETDNPIDFDEHDGCVIEIEPVSFLE